jgi:hypothetical protein
MDQTELDGRGTDSGLRALLGPGMTTGSPAPRIDLRKDRLQTLKPIRFTGRLIPAQTVDPGEAHGEPGLVTG